MSAQNVMVEMSSDSTPAIIRLKYQACRLAALTAAAVMPRLGKSANGASMNISQSEKEHAWHALCARRDAREWMHNDSEIAGNFWVFLSMNEVKISETGGQRWTFFHSLKEKNMCFISIHFYCSWVWVIERGRWPGLGQGVEPSPVGVCAVQIVSSDEFTSV